MVLFEKSVAQITERGGKGFRPTHNYHIFDLTIWYNFITITITNIAVTILGSKHYQEKSVESAAHGTPKTNITKSMLAKQIIVATCDVPRSNDTRRKEVDL